MKPKSSYPPYILPFIIGFVFVLIGRFTNSVSHDTAIICYFIYFGTLMLHKTIEEKKFIP